MAPTQEPPGDQHLNSSGQSAPITVESKAESVELSKDSGAPRLAAETVVPFKSSLYVPPDVTVDSFVPSRSNHGLIFGATTNSNQGLGSSGLSNSLPTPR